MEKVAEVKGQVQANENKATKDAEKEAAFKAKKAEAAKAFTARQKERKEKLIKLAKDIISKDLLGKFDTELQKFIQEAANPSVSTGFGGTSFLNKVFGDNPKVGDKITLFDYMEKTLHSHETLDKYVKEWAGKGIIVECKEAANALETTYEIKKLA
mgnify:CR=1 FL=1